MHIYLLRHGIAEDGAPGMADETRALVPEGVRKLKETLKRARSAGLSPTLILSSPYVRARQTADLAAQILDYDADIVETNLLTPMAHPAETYAELRAFRGEESILLASHEPLMSSLLAYLLGTPQLRVDFKKGALVRVDLPGLGAAPRGVLKWMMAPKLAL